MSDIANSCPTPERLKALIDGALSESDLLITQQHVDQCHACQKQLESLVAGSASWEAAVGRLREDGPPMEETIFSDALHRIKSEEFIDRVFEPVPGSATPLEFLLPSDLPGSIGRLGTYEVTQVVGQGGMGIVLKAFDPALHRVVAVKILAPYLAHNPHAQAFYPRSPSDRGGQPRSRDHDSCDR